MENAVVQILLATYNGEKFIRRQLDSLFNQTFADFTIVVRDDGSTDNTVPIIHEYIERAGGKIKMVADKKKNVGATQNFGILLEHANADYIFFCDQDDVWIPDKMERELQAIRMLEKESTFTPCIVFSDMKVI